MKYFGSALAELLSEHHLSQRALANECSLDQVKISRLLNSAIRADKDDLVHLFTAFRAPADQLRLVRAHIRDEIPDAAFANIELREVETALRDKPLSLPLADLPPRAARALQFLIANYRDVPPLGDLFISLAKAHGWEDLSSSEPGNKKKLPTRYPSASE